MLSADEQDGILSTHLKADGKFGELLKLKYPDRGQSQISDEAWLYMAGNEVFKVAVNQLANIVTETLQANQIEKSDIDWLVPHQANYRIIKATAKKARDVDGSSGVNPRPPWQHISGFCTDCV